MLNENAALADLVMVSTFNPFNLARFRKHCPEVKTGLLTLPGKPTCGFGVCFGMMPSILIITDVDQALVERKSQTAAGQCMDGR
jgi:glycerophosphoryl diester phosphodiesterase